MNTSQIDKLFPSPDSVTDDDLVGIAVFSMFNDASPLAVRMLSTAVQREFELAGLLFHGPEFCGEDFLAVFCKVHEKLPALEVLQAMAHRMKVIGGVKVGWYDRAEGIWRDYYASELVKRGHTFESLEPHVEPFCRLMAERTKALEARLKAARGEGAQPAG